MKAIKAKVQKGWSWTKRLVTCMSVWGLIFSLVTIGRLKAAFDYDDTLVFSAAAFNKASQSGALPFSSQFWTVVNQNYDLEKPKIVSNALAWTLRLFGFGITIMTTRPPNGAEPLKKEWRHLASKFVFLPSPGAKHSVLSQGNYVLFFGDSDSDIQEGRLAHVLPVRIRRSSKSAYKEDYHPGTFREVVIPFSEY